MREQIGQQQQHATQLSRRRVCSKHVVGALSSDEDNTLAVPWANECGYDDLESFAYATSNATLLSYSDARVPTT